MNRPFLLLNRTIRGGIAGIITLAISTSAPAAEPTTAPATAPAIASTIAPTLDPAIAPFVTAGTLFLARADLGNVDLVAIHDAWVSAAQSGQDRAKAGPDIERLNSLLPRAQKWLADFHRAGGRLVYAVAFLGDPADIPAVLIVPLTPAADSNAISSLLVTGTPSGATQNRDAEAIVLNNAVVFGLTPEAEKMRAALPVDRPLLAAALGAINDAPFQIAFSPSIALQLVAGEILPEALPDSAGGGSPADLIHTLAWAAWAGSPPPRASMKLLIQCRDAQGAADYITMFNALLATLANNPAERSAVPDMDRLINALKPQVQDALVSLNLDTATFNDLILPRMLAVIRADSANPSAPPATNP